MIKTPTMEETLESFFFYLSTLYDREKYSDYEAVYQFNLSESEEVYNYYVVIKDRSVFYCKGINENPDIIIDSPVKLWFDIAIGKTDGSRALFARKYKVSGEISFLKEFTKVFGKKLNKNDIDGLDTVFKYDTNVQNWKSPKKVLVINSSPRMKNGFTNYYLQPFIRGMEAAGADVETVFLYKRNIKIEPCIGCEVCQKGNPECIFDDDGQEIIDKILNAELIIYALPLYIDSMPAKLKALLDRCYINQTHVYIPSEGITRHVVRKNSVSYAVLFSVCGFPEIEHFDPLVHTFRNICKNGQTPLIAEILRPGAEFWHKVPECIFYLKDILKGFEKAGKNIIEQGKISEDILETISSNYGISSETWRSYTHIYYHLKEEKVLV